VALATDVERAILARERAALRRLGILAGSAPPLVVFAAMAEELARIADLSTGDTRVDMAAVVRYEGDELVVVASWGETTSLPAPVGSRWPLDGDSVSARVFRSRRPTRIEGYPGPPGSISNYAVSLGVRSTVGVPIVVDGELWGGATVLSSRPEPLPPDTEERLADFAELAATAISGAHAREKAQRLTDEQTALRRVATLVAQGVEPERLFAAVTTEVGQLLEADTASLIRYEDHDEISVPALWSAGSEAAAMSERFPIVAGSMSEKIAATGRSARIDDWSQIPGEIGRLARERLHAQHSVGSPIVVDGRLWGLLTFHSSQHALPPSDIEPRLANFAKLIATAISNAEAQASVRRLADEQASLRRLATLVARESSPEEVFASVVEEVGAVLGVSDSRLLRYEADGTATVLASWGALRDRLPVGTNAPVDGYSVTALVRETRRAARIDDYDQAHGTLAGMVVASGLRSAVACPVVVNGRLWGVTVVASVESEPLPADTADRLTEFTGLVATAIANIDARTALAASRVRIVTAADEARKRMERDLHDGAQQRLVSLALRLRATEAMAPPELDELRSALDQLGHGLTEVHESLRELSQGLHPSVLSEAGLRAALRALARRSAVPVAVSYEAGERFDEALEVTAYYVVSEALANVVKHSGATRATVEVSSGDGTLHVVVADDGHGGADPVRGSGMIGMIDRIEARGGTLTISSPADGGTTLRVALPLEHQ
jgi:signal transduction histidine kinase